VVSKRLLHSLRLFIGPLLGGCLLLPTGCQKPFSASEPALFQPLDSAATGLGFVNRLVSTSRMNILDYLYFYNGGGVAAGDVNGDGRADLYFVANQGPNKLYLNQSGPKTGLRFADVTARAGVAGRADWQTGVTMADVNGDGRLDIYVCAVGRFRGLRGHNELYINQGNDPTGTPVFREQAANYGLAFSGFSTQAAFFDYDHDGDLDCFLLNHAVHTSRSFDPVSARSLRDSLAGDVLFENTGKGRETRKQGKFPPLSASSPSSPSSPFFIDVSAQAGIFQATMGYGLGVAVADFDGDGWEDMYVSNDFHEDDYYYLNNRRGGFREAGRQAFGHTSRFSMGSDAADINNDGWTDLITTDMYPADETVEKSSQGEDPLDIFQYKLNYGYGNQYSRNCLQINQSGSSFADWGSLAGVAATDWSWSPLLADYDLDGQKDLFVANGIVRRPNNLDYVKYLSDNERQEGRELSQTLHGSGDDTTILKMPDGRVPNYLFRGLGEGRFVDKSAVWGFERADISNGAAWADLDNDGDLDLITNNINEPAGLYENRSRQLFPDNRFLKIRLDGSGANRFGVGAKIVLRRRDSLQVQQLMPTRGFESASEPVLTLGLGRWPVVDSVTVIWPDQQVETRVGVRPNQTLTFRQQDARKPDRPFTFTRASTRPLLAEIRDSTGRGAYPIPYRHRENTRYLDFQRESLMPFKLSTEGPHLAIGDVNGDGRADVFAGGARDQPGTLLLQQPDGSLRPSNQPAIAADSVSEDVDAVFFDADNDRDLDLCVVSGGNEFSGLDDPLRDRLYLNDGRGRFSRSAGLPILPGNKSCVRPVDIDRDGDLDLFIGGRVVAKHYGQTPDSYLLMNTGNGVFQEQTDALAPGLRQAGMLTNAAWLDYDRDNDPDLLVVGDWMRPRLFRNDRGHLAEDRAAFGNAPLSGFWQGLTVADFDRDGDPDIMLGNLGLNSKFCQQSPDMLKLWCGDLDKNGRADQLLATRRGVDFFPVAFRDELGKQLPGIINRRFTDYKSMAGKRITDVFNPDELAGAETREVDQFASVWLENRGGTFALHPLPLLAQTSKLFALCPVDLDNDGDLDVLGGGNFYGASSYQGRYDASPGLVLINQGHAGADGSPEQFRAVSAQEARFRLSGEVRDIRVLPTGAGPVVLVARNNARLQVFRRP
jgi:enediyne biosynthesis protein E4